MYVLHTLQDEIHHLLARFNMPIVKWSLTPCQFGRNLMRIMYYDTTHNARLTMSAEITEDGEVYNAKWWPKYLPYLFDWLLRVGTNQTRVQARASAYKLELMQKSYEYELRQLAKPNTIPTH